MRAVREWFAATLVVCGVVLGACAGPASPGPTPAATGSPAPAGTSTPAAGPTPTEEGTVDRLQEIVDAATADLLGRPAAGTGPVRVVLARAETFPDGALGCPRPGTDPAPGPVDGYRVLLGRGERVWLYTAAADGAPVLCPSAEKDGGRELVPPPGPTD